MAAVREGSAIVRENLAVEEGSIWQWIASFLLDDTGEVESVSKNPCCFLLTSPPALRGGSFAAFSRLCRPPQRPQTGEGSKTVRIGSGKFPRYEW